MSVLGLKSVYTVKQGLSPQDCCALGQSLGLRLYFTVYPSSRPNTDTVYPDLSHNTDMINF